MVWSGTPIAANSSIPLMNAAGSGAVNTATNYRKSFIGAFLAPTSGGPMAWRSGVIPTTWDATLNTGAGAHRDLFGIPTTPTNNSHVQVYGGNCVVSRTGATAGPYLVGFNAVTDLPFDSADPTNPRIDVACVRLIDTAIDGAGASQGGYMYVINGTASGSPVVPTIPSDYIPLFKVFRPANDSVIGTGHGTITDMRKGTGVVGSVRPLLAGDNLGDAGSFNGEMTVTSTGTVRRWDAQNTAWRGVTTVGFDQPGGASNVFNYGFGQQLDVGTLTIPDPGYAYRIQATGCAYVQCNSVNPTNTALSENVILVGGTAYAKDRSVLIASNPNNVYASVTLQNTQAYTGSQTVVFRIVNPNSGTFIDILPGTFYQFQVNIIPV